VCASDAVKAKNRLRGSEQRKEYMFPYSEYAHKFQGWNKGWNNSQYEPNLSRKDVIKTLGNRFPLEDREKNWSKHYLEIALEIQKEAPPKEGL
jgi:hypothetical protein